MRKLTAIAAAAIMIGALTACGSADQQTSEPPAGDALIDVRVGVVPFADTAAIYLGKEKGFFEEEGLDLTIETISGGAIAIPGVLSGDYDFAFSNIISLFVARDQGLDLRFVTNGTTSTGIEGADIAAIVVLEDSELQRPSDLEGKTVSSNLLSNIGDTTIRHTVDVDGGDGSKLTFVEVPIPEALGALENGQIDAALIVEPFLSAALDNGGRAIGWNYVAVHPEMDVSGYFTSGQKIADDPDLVERFTRAMSASLIYADENPDEVRHIITTYTAITPEIAETIVLPRFKVDFSRESATILGGAALKYGTISAPVELDELLP